MSTVNSSLHTWYNNLVVASTIRLIVNTINVDLNQQTPCGLKQDIYLEAVSKHNGPIQKTRTDDPHNYLAFSLDHNVF